jgi:hypothetical protein
MGSHFLKTRLLSLTLVLAVTLTFGSAHAGTIWISMGNPTPLAASGQAFDTALKLSSWEGRTGAFEIMVRYDPSLLQIASVAFPPATSDFYGNAYVDINSYKSGTTRICGFQTQYSSDSSSPSIFAIIRWTVLGTPGKLASIRIDPQSMVDEIWRSVDVQTYGIQFIINSNNLDNDLLPDSWEMQYFGDLSRDGRSDYDRDGYSDYWEYVNGTNPLVKDPPGDQGYDPRTDSRVPKPMPQLQLLLFD